MKKSVVLIGVRFVVKLFFEIDFFNFQSMEKCLVNQFTIIHRSALSLMTCQLQEHYLLLES
ncbi:CLUMA_CG006453, isoform A [Clunio marinus]|uniref:CLUMA_CG006453, isoform A n=1 Tax=Clunio marinus TaxID=568069 RepID=A0A1J1HY13_9DIPT|nr:CLUMA_CG006453, isoform A [Clunio marinus]